MRLEAQQKQVQSQIERFRARDRLDRDVLSEDLGDGEDYAGVRVENPFRDR